MQSQSTEKPQNMVWVGKRSHTSDMNKGWKEALSDAKGEYGTFRDPKRVPKHWAEVLACVQEFLERDEAGSELILQVG